MNQTKILRLGVDQREQYIRDGLGQEMRPALVHLVQSFGMAGREMSKEELIDVITSALLDWARKQDFGGN